jgi:hypothetical protein
LVAGALAVCCILSAMPQFPVLPVVFMTGRLHDLASTPALRSPRSQASILPPTGRLTTGRTPASRVHSDCRQEGQNGGLSRHAHFGRFRVWVQANMVGAPAFGRLFLSGQSQTPTGHRSHLKTEVPHSVSPSHASVLGLCSFAGSQGVGVNGISLSLQWCS